MAQPAIMKNIGTAQGLTASAKWPSHQALLPSSERPMRTPPEWPSMTVSPASTRMTSTSWRCVFGARGFAVGA